MATSIFAAMRDEMFETIVVDIEFVGRFAGGNPKDPKMVDAWLKKNMRLTDDDERLRVLRQHLEEMGVEGAHQMDHDKLTEAVSAMAGQLHTEGFKRFPGGGPYFEGRQVKSGIKESVNTLFAGEKWGTTRKGPKNYTAERVFVPENIALPDVVDTDQWVGHVNGPKGPMSTLSYYEFVEKAPVRFEILQLLAQNTERGEPALSADQWARVFTHMELNGLGAKRSQGFGQFVVTGLEVLPPKTARPKRKQRKATDAPEETG